MKLASLAPFQLTKNHNKSTFTCNLLITPCAAHVTLLVPTHFRMLHRCGIFEKTNCKVSKNHQKVSFSKCSSESKVLKAQIGKVLTTSKHFWGIYFTSTNETFLVDFQTLCVVVRNTSFRVRNERSFHGTSTCQDMEDGRLTKPDQLLARC